MTDTVNVPREPTELMIEAGRLDRFFAKSTVVTLWRAMLAAAPKAEPVSDPDELDLYDDRVQAGISWALNQVGLSLGLSIGDWDGGDGSESVEGDVGAEIESILVSAKLRDPETGALATLHPEAPKVEQEPVAWAYRTVGGDWKILKTPNYGRAEGVPLYRHPAPASAELLEALEAIRDLGSDGEHSGDRHARCRQIAREAIAKHKGPQS